MKRRDRSQNKRGFTLIELMTVVVIIGILAAVAIPLGVKYLRKSKTTEAAINLRKIYDGECAYYIEEQTEVNGALITKQFVTLPDTPDTATLGQAKRLGDFHANGWGAIRFQTDGPVLYSYETTADGVGLDASFTARALGDLDEDGITSLFERVGTIDDATGEVKGGAAIYMLDDLE